MLVDDDEGTRIVMTDELRAVGYEVAEAKNGEECLAQLKGAAPDLILLDLQMPGWDGWQTLQRLTESDYAGAIIVLTGGEAETEQIVRALGAGADDFVTKRGDSRELLARVHAVLRRTHPERPRVTVLQFDRVRVDLAALSAEADGHPLALTRTEFKLLEALATAGRALSREELLARVWHYSPEACSRTVDTYIWRLRQKICNTPHAPRWIRTVPGGYRLEVA